MSITILLLRIWCKDMKLEWPSLLPNLIGWCLWSAEGMPRVRYLPDCPFVWWCILVEKLNFDLRSFIFQFKMCCKVRVLTVQFFVVGLKVSYFENLSNRTIILPHPSDGGSPIMKSIETLCQGWLRMGSGWRSPLGAYGSPLSCWHTRHAFTKDSTSSYWCGQQ